MSRGIPALTRANSASSRLRAGDDAGVIGDDSLKFADRDGDSFLIRLDRLTADARQIGFDLAGYVATGPRRFIRELYLDAPRIGLRACVLRHFDGMKARR